MAYNSKGRITRPKKQDIKPKAFDHPAAFMILNYYPLTDRYILWMIAHYPYLFNIHFHEDIARISMSQINNDSNFGKALQILASLKRRKLVKESKDKMKLKITFTGYLYRIKTFHGFETIVFIVGTLIALFSIFFNRIFPQHVELPKLLGKDSTITKLSDSVRQLHPPAPVFLDSANKETIDTSTKTKDKETIR